MDTFVSSVNGYKDNFVSIGDRLREERERLGLSQAALAEMAGAHRKSQGNYEHGGRSPDAEYLNAIAVVGADILYIVTGMRQVAEVQPVHMPPDEEMLLDSYRGLDASAKKRLLAAVLTGEMVSATPAMQINHNSGVAGSIGVVNVDNKRR